MANERHLLSSLIAEREAHARTRLEDAQHMRRLLDDVRYMEGIAVRGFGKPTPEDEPIRAYVLRYVKHVEARADRAEAVIAGLQPIAKAMRDQDNRATAHPVYAVENKSGRMGQFEFVTAFFSLKGAENYIKANAHNLRQPRVFVYSAYRNSEWQAVREALAKLDALEREVGCG